MLRHLAADQGTSRLPAARRNAAHDGLDLLRIEPTDRDVVEEIEGFGPVDDDVVHAHRDQVDADGIVAAGQESDLELRSNADGGRNQDGFAILRWHADEARKAAEPADHLGPARRARQRCDAAYRVLTRVDINAGLAVSQRFHVSRRRAEAAASTRAPCPRGSSR